MTKEELIDLTLKQLRDSFENSPECLHLEESNSTYGNNTTGPTIIWRHRVEINGERIQDPNNSSRTIIASYSTISKQLTVSIFFREVNNLNHALMADATAVVKYSDWPWMHKSYRRFQSLRKKILKLQKEKESLEYLRKLSSVFPGTFEDDLLG